ncbi:MAG: efflux RND transporter periplasmic adaptor subunit [Candidatus Acidiferrales bacterium]
MAGCEKKAGPPPGPPDVEVATVVQRDVPITEDWVGTLNGIVNAQIRAQVSGYLMKQNYANGAYVRKGEQLFQVDPRPFRAALDQAKANLDQAKGNLQRAQAQLGKTELDVTRYTPLAKQFAISQEELDDAVQANLGAEAQVVSGRAAIEAAQAAVETAQLNLAFTSITSPIHGVAGIATAQVGDLVGPQSGALTTVSQVDPILVDFNVSEQGYLRAMDPKIRKEDPLLHKLEFTLTLSNGAIYPLTGRLYAVNREVDVRTGAIMIESEFANPDRLLRPGGFARISTVVRIQQGALLIPQRAAYEIQGGFLVAVVGHDNKVSLRPVKMGARVGGLWVVTEGLQPGERVVAEGVQKVRDGIVVNPKPFQEKPAGQNP